MRQSIIGFISGVAALLFLVGCRENPVRARLAEIDSFAASNPDSARRALEAIDHSFQKDFTTVFDFIVSNEGGDLSTLL